CCSCRKRGASRCRGRTEIASIHARTCGVLGLLPLPIGERGGVRGQRTLDRLGPPHPPARRARAPSPRWGAGDSPRRCASTSPDSLGWTAQSLALALTDRMARLPPGVSMAHDVMQVETDVLVIGSGGAGMYAAVEAARLSAEVFLLDRSLIGRGGATVMAQMTVAVALGSEVPDHWSHHLDDTLAAGRGLCSEPLSRLLCEEGPACVLQMEEWGIGWAR